MDNLITGVLGGGVFVTFVVGLAASIGELPFTIIVGLVSIMMLIDLVQSVRQGLSEKGDSADD